MTESVSPLAPKSYPQMPDIEGVRMATMAAGIKYADRTDLLLMVFDRPTVIAGVFTQSKCPSAPVELCRKHLPGGGARAIVVNSGNANAFTGRKGMEAAEMTVQAAAKAVGCANDEVFLASTGVIGEPLDAGKFAGALKALHASCEPGNWEAAASAIMTTDTYRKLATKTIVLDGVDVTINGIAKGAGMIAPDMATMLSFVTTDAAISADCLQSALAAGVEPTFNSITVDSDTSTSDTVLVTATQAASDRGQTEITTQSSPSYGLFAAALRELLHDLAQQVVRDGEGARKLLEVQVKSAASNRSARQIAFSIANSPLVKTAVAGEDANWGRIVMAVGKAGEEADRDRLAIWFGDIRVAVQGERDPDYSEEAASAVMKEEHIVVTVDVGIGNGAATVWTCDLTKDYVAINGDYRS